MRAYHDAEWGVPEHDDRRLFEFLTLEGAQAGLSWRTILLRREGYRRAFQGFDLEEVAGFDERNVQRLLGDEGIIRHRGKIESTVSNAAAALLVVGEFGSLDAYLWGFVDGIPVKHSFARLADLPTETDASRAMSKDLKRRGFGFVGPTTCYAFMQATGLVNDHETACFRRDQV